MVGKLEISTRWPTSRNTYKKYFLLVTLKLHFSLFLWFTSERKMYFMCIVQFYVKLQPKRIQNCGKESKNCMTSPNSPFNFNWYNLLILSSIWVLYHAHFIQWEQGNRQKVTICSVDCLTIVLIVFLIIMDPWDR